MTGEEDFFTDAPAALTPAQRLKGVNKQITRLRSGFRLRAHARKAQVPRVWDPDAPAALTPAKRLKE